MSGSHGDRDLGEEELGVDEIGDVTSCRGVHDLDLDLS